MRLEGHCHILQQQVVTKEAALTEAISDRSAREQELFLKVRKNLVVQQLLNVTCNVWHWATYHSANKMARFSSAAQL